MTENHGNDIDSSAIFTLPSQRILIEDFPVADGFILDIGAGGEGIIGLVKGRQVIGIDKRRDELAETGNQYLKIIMDATDPKFLDDTFSIATAFFTFMYMSWDDIKKAFVEIKRVLKPGGKLLVWDANIEPPSDPKIKYFVVPLEITLPDNTKIETGYGARIKKQKPNDFFEVAEDVGFVVQRMEEEGSSFYLELLG